MTKTVIIAATFCLAALVANESHSDSVAARYLKAQSSSGWFLTRLFSNLYPR